MKSKLKDFFAGKSEALSLITSSPEETIDFARELGAYLRGGNILALIGDLGAGKTTFTKGIALGTGLPHADEVKSPTFVLMHEYAAQIPINHFDLYRLDRDKDVRSIGLEDYLGSPDRLVIVEWADKGKDYFPRGTFIVHFEWLSDTQRKINLKRKS